MFMTWKNSYIIITNLIRRTKFSFVFLCHLLLILRIFLTNAWYTKFHFHVSRTNKQLLNRFHTRLRENENHTISFRTEKITFWPNGNQNQKVTKFINIPWHLSHDEKSSKVSRKVWNFRFINPYLYTKPMSALPQYDKSHVCLLLIGL